MTKKTEKFPQLCIFKAFKHIWETKAESKSWNQLKAKNNLDSKQKINQLKAKNTSILNSKQKVNQLKARNNLNSTQKVRLYKKQRKMSYEIRK